MNKVKSGNSFDSAKFCYAAVYAVFLVLNKFVLFQAVPHGIISAVYMVLALGGVVLLAMDFFTRRDMFRVPGSSILFLYMIVMLLSVLVNAGYGIVSNLKTLAWSAIQFFLICALPWNADEAQRKKRMLLVFHILSGIWLVGVAASFFEFMVGYSGKYVLPDSGVRRHGFVDGRLFGVFTDPNLAAVFSICIILMILYELLQCRTSLAGKIYSVVNIVFQLIYVILSNSRTALVISAACCLGGVILILPKYLRSLHWRMPIEAVCICMAGILASAALVGAIQGLKSALILLPRRNPVMIQQIENTMSRLPIAYTPGEDGETELPKDDEITMDRPDIQDEENVSNNRFEIWSGYLEVFKQVPVIGTSPRNALAVAEHFLPAGSFILERQYSIHNGYLSVLVCTGILGAAVVVLWIVYVLKTVFTYLYRKHKKADGSYFLAAALSLVELCLAISAFFMMGIFFGNSVLEFVFWYTMGNLLCTIRRDAPELFKQEPAAFRISEKIFHSRRKLS